MKFLKLNSFIKSLVKKNIKLLPSMFNGPFVINFHGITNSYQNCFFDDLHLHVDIFYQFLKDLKLNFDIKEISSLDYNKSLKHKNTKDVYITFDDGYKNNLDVAAPIIKSLGISAIIFVSTNNVNYQEHIPTYFLKIAARYLEKREYSFDSIKKTICFENESINQKKLKYFYSSLNIKDLKLFIEELKELVGYKELLEFNNVYKNHTIMNWDEVKQILNYNFKIGSHGDDHYILNNKQTTLEINNQINNSYKIILKKNGSCKYFAYPNGGANDISLNAIKILKSSNYDLAFTMWSTSAKYSKSKYLIPRISSQDIFDFKYQILKSFISHKHYNSWYSKLHNN